MDTVWDTAVYPCDGLLSGLVECACSDFDTVNVISMTSKVLHGQAALHARTGRHGFANC